MHVHGSRGVDNFPFSEYTTPSEQSVSFSQKDYRLDLVFVGGGRPLSDVSRLCSRDTDFSFMLTVARKGFRDRVSEQDHCCPISLVWWRGATVLYWRFPCTVSSRIRVVDGESSGTEGDHERRYDGKPPNVFMHAPQGH